MINRRIVSSVPCECSAKVHTRQNPKKKETDMASYHRPLLAVPA
jgi:hypothetical protein